MPLKESKNFGLLSLVTLGLYPGIWMISNARELAQMAQVRVAKERHLASPMFWKGDGITWVAICIALYGDMYFHFMSFLPMLMVCSLGLKSIFAQLHNESGRIGGRDARRILPYSGRNVVGTRAIRESESGYFRFGFVLAARRKCNQYSLIQGSLGR